MTGKRGARAVLFRGVVHSMQLLCNKKTLAWVLIVVVFVPTALLVQPQKTHAAIGLGAITGALSGMAACAIGSALGTLVSGAISGIAAAFPALGSLLGGGALVPTDPKPSELRECTLDAIVWSVINDMIKQILRDTTKWIENGFQGEPAFVSDFPKFMKRVADNAINAFISENFAELCEPFRFSVTLALVRSYNDRHRDTKKYACTLDEIRDNIERFLAGDWGAGGRYQFLKVMTTRGGNPFNIIATGELHGLGFEKQEAEATVNILEWGNGFLPSTECVRDKAGPSGRCANIMVTPGKVIENQVNHILGAPQRRLEMADEINELIEALLAQLITGLFSSGSRGSGLISSQGRGWASTHMDMLTDLAPKKAELLRKIDELIAEATRRGDQNIVASAQQLRTEVDAIDVAAADAATRLRTAETSYRLLMMSLVGTDDGAVPCGITCLPPYDNPGIADEPAQPATSTATST